MAKSVKLPSWRQKAFLTRMQKLPDSKQVILHDHTQRTIWDWIPPHRPARLPGKKPSQKTSPSAQGQVPWLGKYLPVHPWDHGQRTGIKKAKEPNKNWKKMTKNDHWKKRTPLQLEPDPRKRRLSLSLAGVTPRIVQVVSKSRISVYSLADDNTIFFWRQKFGLNKQNHQKSWCW